MKKKKEISANSIKAYVDKLGIISLRRVRIHKKKNHKDTLELVTEEGSLSSDDLNSLQKLFNASSFLVQPELSYSCNCCRTVTEKIEIELYLYECTLPEDLNE